MAVSQIPLITGNLNTSQSDINRIVNTVNQIIAQPTAPVINISQTITTSEEDVPSCNAVFVALSQLSLASLTDAVVNNTVNNLGLGQNALNSLTDGEDNLAVGKNALTACTTGDDNIAIGLNALAVSTIATNNIAIGTGSGVAITDGGSNVLIGSSAGENITEGTNNIIIGTFAGQGLTTGSSNIIIGVAADTPTDDQYLNIGGAIKMQMGAATYILPTNDGIAGDALKTDGAGNLYWEAP